MTMTGEDVIFVGGSMRSGTTLLQRILCASPDTHKFTDECQFLTAMLDLHAAWRQQFTSLREFYGTPERFDHFAKTMVDSFLQATFDTLRPVRAIVLKNPKLTLHFPTLADWYGRAKFVAVVRDPRDTIASMLDVASRHDAANVEGSVLVDMGRDMLRLSRFYKSYYAEALQSPKSRHRVGVVRYEDLVTQPDQAIGALSKHLGIALRQELLSPDTFGRREGNSFNAAFWTELSLKPPSPASVGRFREVLSADEIAAIEQHCADFNRIFNYW